MPATFNGLRGRRLLQVCHDSRSLIVDLENSDVLSGRDQEKSPEATLTTSDRELASASSRPPFRSWLDRYGTLRSCRCRL